MSIAHKLGWPAPKSGEHHPWRRRSFFLWPPYNAAASAPPTKVSRTAAGIAIETRGLSVVVAIASAPLTRVSRIAEGVLIETGGASVRVGLREWAMPLGRGTRERFICPRCGSSRDALHWVGEWGCRGEDCLNLDHACRHEQRYCPAIRRRAKLLRKLARARNTKVRRPKLRRLNYRHRN